MKTVTDLSNSHTLMNLVQRHGGLTVVGNAAISKLPYLLKELQKTTGLQVVFDPSSDPDLLDYTVSMATKSLAGGTLGTVLGGLIGALFGAPHIGARVGAVVGGSAGAMRGLEDVNQGWRVYLLRQQGNATPVAVIDITGK